MVRWGATPVPHKHDASHLENRHHASHQCQHDHELRSKACCTADGGHCQLGGVSSDQGGLGHGGLRRGVGSSSRGGGGGCSRLEHRGRGECHSGRCGRRRGRRVAAALVNGIVGREGAVANQNHGGAGAEAVDVDDGCMGRERRNDNQISWRREWPSRTSAGCQGSAS